MKFLLWVSSTELLTELQWVRVPKKRTYGPDMNSSRDVHADTFSELVMEPIFCSKISSMSTHYSTNDMDSLTIYRIQAGRSIRPAGMKILASSNYTWFLSGINPVDQSSKGSQT